MSDYDPGVNVLDVIEHCDEGKQLRHLEREFAFHRDRAIEANGGKIKVTITMSCNVLNRNEMTTSVAYKVTPAVRRSAVDTVIHLDAEHQDPSTMRLTNIRQTRIKFAGPTMVVPARTKE